MISALVPVIVVTPVAVNVPEVFAVARVVKSLAATLPVSLTVNASSFKPVTPVPNAAYNVTNSDNDPLIAVTADAFTASVVKSSSEFKFAAVALASAE